MKKILTAVTVMLTALGLSMGSAYANPNKKPKQPTAKTAKAPAKKANKKAPAKAKKATKQKQQKPKK